MSKPEAEPQQQFKLAELSKAAGIAKKTIHYYLNKGLLPPATKVHNRLSLYNDNHLNLLKLIQKIKKETNLPLTLIQNLFSQRNFDAKALEDNEVRELLKSSSDTEALNPYFDTYKATKIKPVDLTADFQDQLFKAGIISSAQGRLESQEENIAFTLVRANELGVSPTTFAKLNSVIDEIVAEEKQILLENIIITEDYKTSVDQLLEIDFLINSFIKHRKSLQLRKAFSQAVKDVPFSIKSLNEKLYIPSPAFFDKHNINQQIEKCLNKIKQQPDNKQLRLNLADTYIILGEYQKAKDETDILLKQDKNNADALIASATANVFLNESLDDISLDAERAANIRPNNARILSYCAMVYLMQGARVSGIFSPAQWLKKSLDAFNKVLTIDPESKREKVEVLLMKGRAYSILPTPLDKVDEGITALEDLLTIIENNNDDELQFPSECFREIVKINAYFYLGEAYLMKKDKEKSKKAFEQVLLKDPASNFGANAFKKLN